MHGPGPVANVEIRRCRYTDWREVVSIFEASFPELRRAALGYVLSRPQNHVLVAEVRPELAGFCAFHDGDELRCGYRKILRPEAPGRTVLDGPRGFPPRRASRMYLRALYWLLIERGR